MPDIKILYVEDDADIRTLAEFALEDEGFVVEFCVDGEKALHKAETFIPDVVILDVMMPGMDGPTTFKRLREMEAFKKIPIIFMTAKTKDAELDDLRALGADEIILKPFDPMLLPDNIRKILER